MNEQLISQLMSKKTSSKLLTVKLLRHRPIHFPSFSFFVHLCDFFIALTRENTINYDRARALLD